MKQLHQWIKKQKSDFLIKNLKQIITNLKNDKFNSTYASL